MGGAPILVTCYRNGIDSYGTWITDATALTRDGDALTVVCSVCDGVVVVTVF